MPREGLEAKVRQRVNVRVLELIETESGSRIELEGLRLRWLADALVAGLTTP